METLQPLYFGKWLLFLGKVIMSWQLWLSAISKTSGEKHAKILMKLAYIVIYWWMATNNIGIVRFLDWFINNSRAGINVSNNIFIVI